jgi:anti-sigma-K factor RskA
VNGRILPFEGHAHRDIQQMLPWYANGTLDIDDAERVRLHLIECVACRAELATQRAVLDAVAHMPTREDARETDHAWHRMRDRLDVVRHTRTTRFDWRRVRAGWHGAAPWLRVALAAQCAAVAVLVALLLQPATRQPEFTTLSATPAPMASRDTLLVVFDPRITDAQMRDLLGANHARIVDGPNATGAWLVAAPPGQAEPVRNALRASAGVAMAERLAPPER